VKRIKIVGLAVVMTLSLAAFAGSASASSPSFFTAGTYPATISNSLSGEGGGSISLPRLGTYNCASPALGGSLAKPSEALTTSVNFNGGCGNVSAQKCEFTFHPPAEGANGTVDIGGTSCTGMTGQMLANFVVPAQSGLAATFENEGSGSTAKVKVKINSGLKYDVTNGAYKGSYSDGVLTLTVALAGQNGGGSTGVQVSPYPGLSVTGAGSARLFHADLYPVMIGGGQVEGEVGGVKYAKNQLGTAAGTLSCNTLTLATPSSLFPTGLGEDVESLLVSPTFAGCTLAGLGATVTPEEGCFFTASPYIDSMSLCGLEIKVVGSLCKVKVAPQGRSGVEFVNVGSGSNAEVEAKANLGSLQYEVITGNKCPGAPASGSYANGTYKGAIKLNVAKVA
jgi:hypothetical protein